MQPVKSCHLSRQQWAHVWSVALEWQQGHVMFVFSDLAIHFKEFKKKKLFSLVDEKTAFTGWIWFLRRFPLPFRKWFGSIMVSSFHFGHLKCRFWGKVRKKKSISANTTSIFNMFHPLVEMPIGRVGWFPKNFGVRFFMHFWLAFPVDNVWTVECFVLCLWQTYS